MTLQINPAMRLLVSCGKTRHAYHAIRAGTLLWLLATSACSTPAANSTASSPAASSGVDASADKTSGPFQAKIAIDIAIRESAAGDPLGAISYYREALALDPKQAATASIGLGDAQLDAGAPTDAAAAYRSALQNSLITAAQSAHASVGLGVALLALNHPEQALSPLRDGLKAVPDARGYRAQTIAQDMLGQFPQAVAGCETGMAQFAGDQGLREDCGLSQALTGNFDKAVATMRTAAAAQGATARDRLNLALVLGLAGRDEEARSTAEVDLDATSIQANLAYYAQLRRLPAQARAMALLEPNSVALADAPIAAMAPTGNVAATALPPIAQTDVAQSKVARAPIAQTPIAQTEVAQAEVAQAPITAPAAAHVAVRIKIAATPIMATTDAQPPAIAVPAEISLVAAPAPAAKPAPPAKLIAKPSAKPIAAIGASATPVSAPVPLIAPLPALGTPAPSADDDANNVSRPQLAAAQKTVAQKTVAQKTIVQKAVAQKPVASSNPLPAAVAAVPIAAIKPAPLTARPAAPLATVAAPSVTTPTASSALAKASPPPPGAPISVAAVPAAATSAPVPSGGPEVQLGALISQAAAEKEWRHLQATIPNLLADHQPRFSTVVRNGNTFYRLRTAGFSGAADAREFCVEVIKAGGRCEVI
jgi:tetratricopeptide (TPR) repeat protein